MWKVVMGILTIPYYWRSFKHEKGTLKIMRETKVSPLGGFCIALFVQHWNNSKNVERKKAAVTYLKSTNDPLTIMAGFVELQNIVHEELRWHDAALADLNRTSGSKIGLLAALLLSGPESGDVYESSWRIKILESVDKAKAEVALYFSSMFRAGCFEQLPMPQFEYSFIEKA